MKVKTKAALSSDGAGRGSRLPQDEQAAVDLLKQLFRYRDKERITNRQLAEKLNQIGFRIAKRTLDGWSYGRALPRPESLLGIRVAIKSLSGQSCKCCGAGKN